MRKLTIAGIMLAGAFPAGASAQAAPNSFCGSAGPTGAFYPQVTTCATPWIIMRNDDRARWEAEEAARRREEAEASRRAAAAREAEADQRRAQAAALARDEKEAAQRAKARSASLAAREAEDRALGYKHITIADFLLDFRDMPAGSKVVLEGLHYSLGQLETLSANELSAQPIYLQTNNLPREIRKSVIECHQRAPFCGATIWAHTGCVVSALGLATEAPCLVVDLLSGGHYAAQAGSIKKFLPAAAAN